MRRVKKKKVALEELRNPVKQHLFQNPAAEMLYLKLSASDNTQCSHTGGQGRRTDQCKTAGSQLLTRLLSCLYAYLALYSKDDVRNFTKTQLQVSVRTRGRLNSH